MKLLSNTFQHQEYIPERCAFGIKDTENHMALGKNKNPQLIWSDIHEEAKSLVLICVDTDVPSSLDNFNKEGKTISKDLPRVNFYHWGMVDIKAEDGSVDEG